MVFCAATQKVMFLRQLLNELSVVLTYHATMMEDNEGCISYANITLNTSKSKHINVKMPFVRDAIRDNIIVVPWCSTHDIIT